MKKWAAAYNEDRHWEVNGPRYEKKSKETTEADFNDKNRFLVGRRNWIDKSAADDDFKQEGLSLAAIGAGGATAAKFRDQAIGMETRYHGTSRDAANSIKQTGLLASRAGDGVSSRRADLRSKLGDEAVDGKVYLGKNRKVSKNFATQAGLESVGVRSGTPLEVIVDDELDFGGKIKKIREGYSQGEVLKARIPYNELNDGTFKIVDNPELRGLSRGDFVDQLYRESVPPGAEGMIPENQRRSIRNMIGKSYDQLNAGTDVIEGDVASRYFKGGEGYRGQSLRGVIDYARANPGRFARGAGAAGAGLGIAGAGAYGLYDGARNRMSSEKTAFVGIRESMEKIAAYYNKK